ncbi:MAG TPA: 30S ribosomal protein S17 [Patescibacteria group bacterium]|nr:30S ribosomal protein S17 [Patescibacteria group bacterium]
MKIFTGKVISNKMTKTATVAVERVIIHPLYKKRFRRDTNFQVHDEMGVKIGDVVKFTASKPMSKTKKWKILEVVSSKKSKVKEEKKGATK